VADASEIAAFLQRELSRRGISRATAVEAARWLDKAGLLRDSMQRRGRNIRHLLREGSIPGAVQEPPVRYGRWFIERTDAVGGPSRSEGCRPVLPDYLDKGLKVVFVGTAPSDESARAGHYYANPNNRFWRLLYEAGFTEARQLRPEEDRLVLRYGLGLTDVLKFDHSGSDERLPLDSFGQGAAALKEKLERYAPRFVCFTSKNAYEAFAGRSCSFGLQNEMIGRSRVFVTPSPSGRVSPTRKMDGKTRLEWYRELLGLVASMGGVL